MTMTTEQLETLRSAADQMAGRAGELLRMSLDHADRLQDKLTAAYAANQHSFDAGEARARKWYESKLAQDAQQAAAVPDGWKPVPLDPTPEMVDAAANAHMPFGDMDIAVRMAILSAPVQPASDHARDVNMIEPASLPRPQPVFWYRKRSDGGIDGPISEAAIEDCRRVTWTPLYESVMPGCYWCDQTVKMGDAYGKGHAAGWDAAMRRVEEQRGDALLVPRDVLELLEEAAVEDHASATTDEIVCRCCGEVSLASAERHAENCAVAVAQRLLAGGDA